MSRLFCFSANTKLISACVGVAHNLASNSVTKSPLEITFCLALFIFNNNSSLVYSQSNTLVSIVFQSIFSAPTIL